jgi:hypothetical protein
MRRSNPSLRMDCFASLAMTAKEALERGRLALDLGARASRPHSPSNVSPLPPFSRTRGRGCYYTFTMSVGHFDASGRRERKLSRPNLHIHAVVGGAAPFPPERPCEDCLSRDVFRVVGFLAPSCVLAGALEKQSQNLEGRCPGRNSLAGE